MLETVREFAAERLVAAGESDATYRRLATACLALAEQAGAELRGADQGAWLARLEREHDNFRAVLTWALSPAGGAPPDGRLEIALRLGGALWRFWFMRGDLLEGEHWLETALAQVHAVAESPPPSQHAPPVPAAVRASAHTGAGEMAWGRGDIERARRHHEAALALRRAQDDPDGVAQSLHNLGNLALERGDYGQARALHEEALAIRRARGSPRDVALSLCNLGRLAALRGEYGTAHILLEESLRLAAQVGGNLSRAWPLHALGELALLEGDAAAAAGAFAESLALAREVGLKEAVGALEGIALAAALGEAEPAVRLLGAAEAVRETIRAPQLPTERVHSAPAVARLRAALGVPAFDAAWAAGRRMGVDEAIETGLAVASDARVPATGGGGAAPGPVGPLSPREHEVAELIAQGCSNREIAARLVITEGTATNHVTHILNKLGLRSRTQIAVWASASREGGAPGTPAAPSRPAGM